MGRGDGVARIAPPTTAAAQPVRQRWRGRDTDHHFAPAPPGGATRRARPQVEGARPGLRVRRGVPHHGGVGPAQSSRRALHQSHNHTAITAANIATASAPTTQSSTGRHPGRPTGVQPGHKVTHCGRDPPSHLPSHPSPPARFSTGRPDRASVTRMCCQVGPCPTGRAVPRLSKTVEVARPPRVRIPHSPLEQRGSDQPGRWEGPLCRVHIPSDFPSLSHPGVTVTS